MISFDGTVNSIVDLRTTLQCVQGNNPRSISFMMQTTYSGCGCIISTGTIGGAFGVMVSCNGATPNIIGVYTWSSLGGDYYPSTGKVINDGLWHTVLVTYDGTTLLIYVDGRLDNTKIFSNGLNTIDNSGNYLGQQNDGINKRWIGKLKNVQFYDYVITNTYQLANSYQLAGSIIYNLGNCIMNINCEIKVFI